MVDAGVEEGESLLDSPPSKPVASGRASESMGGLMMFVDVLVSFGGRSVFVETMRGAVEGAVEERSGKGVSSIYVVVERCGGYETR